MDSAKTKLNILDGIYMDSVLNVKVSKDVFVKCDDVKGFFSYDNR